MNYIYFELETTGASPLYSRINAIWAVGLLDGAFRMFQRKIESLTDESQAVAEFSAFAAGFSAMAYPNEKALSFITSCLEQYCIKDPFSSMISCTPSSEEIIAAFGKEHFSKLITDASIEGEFKHFYKDYKDYYYLPAEDSAYHKSVAQFVDRSARIQATAQTAYTKKAGTFIPASPYSDCPVFKTAYNDPQSYIPVSDQDPDAMTCLHLVSHIPQGA